MRIKRNSQKGSSLIEAIVALGAIVVTIAAVSILTAVSASNTEYIKNQNTANKYAQAGMEFIKSMKDESYGKLIQNIPVGTSRCLTGDLPHSVFDTDFSTKVPSGTCLGYGQSIDNQYRRTVVLDNSTDCDVAGATLDSKRVTVNVSWQSGKCSSGQFCHNVTLTSCITQPSAALP